MVNHIAYPDELLEEKKLIEFYEKVIFYFRRENKFSFFIF